MAREEVDWDKLDRTKFFVAGAGLFSGVTTMLFPITVIKTRQMTMPGVSGGFQGTKQTASAIWRNDGLRGFYRGFGTVVFGTLPARVVYLSVLEMTKTSCTKACAALNVPETTAAGLANGVAGAMSSLVSQSILVPIDVVSQRLMVLNTTGPAASAVASAATAATVAATAADAASRVVTTVGGAAGASGGAPHVKTMTTLATASWSDQANAARGVSHGSAGAGPHSSATAAAEAAAASASRALRMNGLRMAQQIVKQEGVWGLYRGFGASVATFVPSSACWWGAYGAYQKALWHLLERVPSGSSSSSSSGAATATAPVSTAQTVAVQTSSSVLAGMTSGFLTNPLDVVKTRLQVARVESGGRAPTFGSTARLLVQQEGLMGLWRGVVPRMASAGLWGTAMVSTYEFLKRISRLPDPQPLPA